TRSSSGRADRCSTIASRPSLPLRAEHRLPVTANSVRISQSLESGLVDSARPDSMQQETILMSKVHNRNKSNLAMAVVIGAAAGVLLTLSAGPAHAQSAPQTITMSPAQVEAYWTPQQIVNAIPDSAVALPAPSTAPAAASQALEKSVARDGG